MYLMYLPSHGRFTPVGLYMLSSARTHARTHTNTGTERVLGPGDRHACGYGASRAGCARRTNANNTCTCTRKSLIEVRVGTTFADRGCERSKLRS